MKHEPAKMTGVDRLASRRTTARGRSRTVWQAVFRCPECERTWKCLENTLGGDWAPRKTPMCDGERTRLK